MGIEIKYTCANPCPGCPFLKRSSPGWLGDYKAEDIIKNIRLEEPFLCHTKIEYDDPDWKDNGPHEHCVGYLIMMRKMAKLPRDHAMCRAAMAVDKKHPGVFETPQAFIDHHVSGPTIQTDGSDTD